jgi:hypothetical protein
MLFPGHELPPSVMSLPVVAYRRTLDPDRAPIKLDQATGFLVRHEERLYLITNWHVLTGRNPVTGDSLGGSASLPEYVEVSFPVILGGDLCWTVQRLDLYDTHTGKARWLVHPYAPPMDGGTDVVALPIDAEPPSVYAHRLEDALDARELSPGAELSIVGYPFGVKSHASVWSRATVASEPRHGFNNDPVYLVDARSRPGQSGSPVVARDSRLPIDERGKSPTVSWTLAGVYSGRVDTELDLGRVWWPVVIREVLQHMQPDRLSFE